jgi:hypothetical protein
LPPCARWLVAVVVVAVVVDRSASPGKWSGFWVGLLEGMDGRRMEERGGMGRLVRVGVVVGADEVSLGDCWPLALLFI